MRYITNARVIAAAGLLLLVLGCSSMKPTDTVAPTVVPTVALVPATQAPTPTVTPTSMATAVPTLPPSASPLATATPIPIPTPTPLPVVAPAPTGRAGGSLRIAGFANVPHRDVHQTVQETLTSLGPGLAYSRLLKVRSGPETDQPSLVLECDLCIGWDLTPDFAYVFELRPDVRWQDIPPVNGRPLTADDLAFSYERLRTPGWPNAGLFNSIGNIDAVNPHTLRVSLATADADALLSLADGHSKVVAREVVEQFGDLRDSPVIGTGAWIWESTEHGIGTSFSRNPNYFEDGLPYLDGLEILAIRPLDAGLSADQERLAAFQGGAVDMALLPPLEWQVLQSSSTDTASIITKQAGTGVLFSMNVQSPPLTQLGVRRAILRAIDPWDYVDTLWSGQGFVSLGIPVQGPEWLLNRDEMRSHHFADPGTAREMLSGMGVAIPEDIELTVRTEGFGQVYLDLEQRVANDLREVGFNPIIRRLNPTQFSESVLEHKDYQVALGVFPPTATTNSFLMGLLHSGGRWNIASHQDSVLDSMIEGQAGQFDPEIRKELLKQIQRHVLEQAYLFSPITGASRWVFSQDVKGFYPNAVLSEYSYWSRVWLDR